MVRMNLEYELGRRQIEEQRRQFDEQYKRDLGKIALQAGMQGLMGIGGGVLQDWLQYEQFGGKEKIEDVKTARDLSLRLAGGPEAVTAYHAPGIQEARVRSMAGDPETSFLVPPTQEGLSQVGEALRQPVSQIPSARGLVTTPPIAPSVEGRLAQKEKGRMAIERTASEVLRSRGGGMQLGRGVGLNIQAPREKKAPTESSRKKAADDAMIRLQRSLNRVFQEQAGPVGLKMDEHGRVLGPDGQETSMTVGIGDMDKGMLARIRAEYDQAQRLNQHMRHRRDLPGGDLFPVLPDGANLFEVGRKYVGAMLQPHQLPSGIRAQSWGLKTIDPVTPTEGSKKMAGKLAILSAWEATKQGLLQIPEEGIVIRAGEATIALNRGDSTPKDMLLAIEAVINAQKAGLEVDPASVGWAHAALPFIREAQPHWKALGLGENILPGLESLGMAFGMKGLGKVWVPVISGRDKENLRQEVEKSSRGRAVFVTSMGNSAFDVLHALELTLTGETFKDPSLNVAIKAAAAGQGILGARTMRDIKGKASLDKDPRKSAIGQAIWLHLSERAKADPEEQIVDFGGMAVSEVLESIEMQAYAHMTEEAMDPALRKAMGQLMGPLKTSFRADPETTEWIIGLMREWMSGQ
jgi:hypothetical protein